MTTEFKMPEPVATVEAWTNRSHGRNYNLNWQGQAEAGESLYTSVDMRAVIEQCAKICIPFNCSSPEIRKLLEQVK